MSKWFYIKEKDKYSSSKIDSNFPFLDEFKSFFKEENVKNMINNEDWDNLFKYYKSYKIFYTLCLELLANFLDLCGVEFYLNEKPNPRKCRWEDLRCWEERH